jgi:hypothetical protein
MSKRMLISVVAVLAISACGGSTSTATLTPSSASTPNASASPTASGPTLASLDPCVMVPQKEASQVAGASYGAGAEETLDNGAKECVYGSKTLNVFIVEVNVGPDAATAQADWATTEAEAQAGLTGLAATEGANVNLQASAITLSGADDAAVASASGAIGSHTLSVSAIYVLKGAVFFLISDALLDKPAPAAAVLAREASTVLTRI